jgi:uncharacterized protein (TIGR00369 family)
MDQTQLDGRTRTFAWPDPAVYAAHVGRTSGTEFMRMMIASELPPPPIMHTLGVERIEGGDGRVTVTMVAREYHYNPLGVVHGGVLATLLDTAAGCAVHTTLPVGVGYTSLDLTTKFLRPVTVESGRLTCVGTVLSRGRRTALAEARLTDERDRLVAHATSSCLIFPVPPAPSP